MIRNLKAMGLALLALLAFGALAAQSASAVVEHSFTSDSSNEKTVLTGTTESGTKETFKLTNASVSCEDVVYRGTVVGNSEDHVSVFPDFSGASTKCSAGILGAATITNHGCTYTFDSDTFENPTHYGAGALHANVSVACNHEKSITIAAGGCTITVKDTSGAATVNQNLPGIRYNTISNHAGTGKTAVTVEATVRTIHATTVGANCTLVGLGSNGTHTNGTYEGKAIVTGYKDDGGTGHGALTEGATVNIGLSTP